MSSNGQATILVIRGLGGYLEGEVLRLRYGQAVRIGRSRHCGFSLKGSRRFRNGDRKKCLEDPDFLRVSREHLEIAYPHAGMVEVRNLGRNGTFVDGKRIEKVLLTRLDECRIRFGGKEELSLAWEQGTD
jgi:hypothetical protein